MMTEIKEIRPNARDLETLRERNFAKRKDWKRFVVLQGWAEVHRVQLKGKLRLTPAVEFEEWIKEHTGGRWSKSDGNEVFYFDNMMTRCCFGLDGRYNNSHTHTTHTRIKTMITDLKFMTKEEYLAWRAEWRAAYKKLSLTIREKKQKRNWLFKNGEHAGVVQATLVYQRAKAATYMEARTESKKIAGQQSETRQAVSMAA